MNNNETQNAASYHSLYLTGHYKAVQGGQTPLRATVGSAAYDCFARTEGSIDPGQRKIVPLGFHFEIQDMEVRSGSPSFDSINHDSLLPADLYHYELRPRSGLAAKHGITLLNSPGTIDADYEDEVCAILVNHGDSRFTWKVGDRICQAIWPMLLSWQTPHSGLRSNSLRREGGFGSSGT